MGDDPRKSVRIVLQDKREACYKYRVGRCRHAYKGIALPGINIKFCQADGRKNRNEQEQVLINTKARAKALPAYSVEYKARSYTKAYHIGKRIELFAHFATHF